MNKRVSLAAVAVVGVVAVATWSAAQSPSGSASPPAGSNRARLTSSTDSTRAELDRPLRSAPLRGDLERGDSSLGSLASATEIRIDHALVTSVDPIQVPALEAGAIVSITDRKGEVKAGDVLGQLYDADSKTKKKIAELERDAARLQAESDAQVKAAKDGAKVTEENYKANEKLRNERPGSLSDFDFRRSWFEWQRALAQIAVAEVEKNVANATQLAKEGQIEAAVNEIDRRKILAPIDGIVTEIYKHRGEWCQPGDPVLELVRMDRVEVEGFVYAADASPSKVVGKPVEIVVHLAGGETYKTTGTIDFASPVLEGSGRIRQFRVSTRIDNKKDGDYWVIQPGSEAQMTIQLVPPKPATPARTTSPAGSKGALKGTKVESYKPAISEQGVKAESKNSVKEDKSDAKSKDKADSKASVKSETTSKTDKGKSGKENRLPAKPDVVEKTPTKADEKGTEKSDKDAPKTPTKIKL
jgi:multidrug efflux pump subunit AcrA (membrane-fusion protein)